MIPTSGGTPRTHGKTSKKPEKWQKQPVLVHRGDQEFFRARHGF
jgi:hypothetical protein